MYIIVIRRNLKSKILVKDHNGPSHPWGAPKKPILNRVKLEFWGWEYWHCGRVKPKNPALMQPTNSTNTALFKPCL